MRSIRRAAIAGATAAALVLGAASAATAEEPAKTGKESSTSKIKNSLSSDKDKKNKEGQKKGKNELSAKLKHTSTEWGHKLEADKPANGARLFGSTSDASKEPKWAQYMKIVTIVGLVGSFLGLVVFPAYNFAVANHLLPGMPPR